MSKKRKIDAEELEVDEPHPDDIPIDEFHQDDPADQLQAATTTTTTSCPSRSSRADKYLPADQAVVDDFSDYAKLRACRMKFLRPPEVFALLSHLKPCEARSNPFPPSSAPPSLRHLSSFEQLQSDLETSEFKRLTSGRAQIHIVQPPPERGSIHDMISRPGVRDRVAIVPCTEGCQQLSYGEIVQFIVGMGDVGRVGIRSPDETVMYMPPTPSGAVAAVAFLAIASQCRAAPIDPKASAQTIKDAINQLRPAVVLTFTAAAMETAHAAIAMQGMVSRPTVVRAELSAGTGLFHLPLLVQASHARVRIRNPQDGVALLLRTSGTTGKPKIVPITNGSLVTNAYANAEALHLGTDDMALNAQPLFHIGGISSNLLSSLAAGSCVCCLDGEFSSDKFLQILFNGCGGRTPTWYNAVPSMHLLITEVAKGWRAEQRETSLRFIRSGAAALSVSLKMSMEETFEVPVLNTYSMTEQMPICQPVSQCDQNTKEVSVHAIPCLADMPSAVSMGMPLVTSMVIVDSHLDPLPFCISGEVCISGPTVFKGYTDNEQENARSFFTLSGSEFFRTGDIGQMDSSGNLFVTGRLKELIKRGGEQVDPKAVEEVICLHPAVQDCIVFSIPCAIWGENVGCALKMVAEIPDCLNEFQAELHAFVIKQGMPPFMAPEHVVIMDDDDEFPTTPTGKRKRNGAAEFLGLEISPIKLDAMLPANADQLDSDSQVVISSAFDGVRWFLAVAVMFNHIGSFEDGWDKSREFCLHPPAFFFIGGFSLAAATKLPITSGQSRRVYYSTMAAILHPPYLISLVLLVVNFVVRCNPGNFESNFVYDRQPTTHENSICQATLLEMPWSVTMVTSLIVHLCGLQAWFFAIPFAWFLSAYSWFSSVYQLHVAVFPWIHAASYRTRDNLCLILRSLACWLLAHYCMIGVMFLYFAMPDGSEEQSFFALSAYLFPIGWLPCFAIGVCSYSLFAHQRPYEGGNGPFYWGMLTDGISCAALAVFVLFGMSNNEVTPRFVTGSLDQRFMAFFLSRIVCPISFVWLYGLAVGRGFTAAFFKLKIFATYLAPGSYNIYLFHQAFLEYYSLMKDQTIWAYPKNYYWFSPLPLQVKWYEFFILVIVVSIFSFAMNSFVTSPMTTTAMGFTHWLFGVDQPEPNSTNAKPTTEVVLSLWNKDTVKLSDKLTSLGIGSMQSLILVSKINQHFPHVNFTVFDLLSLETAQDLVEYINGCEKN